MNLTSRKPKGPGLRLVSADCPWPYQDRKVTRRDNASRKPKFGIGAHGNYSAGTMKAEDILDLGYRVEPLLADDAYLNQWVTGPRLELGLESIPAWGFDFKTILHTWTKIYRVSGSPFAGPGRYTFSNVELGLLGVRGKPWHSSLGFRPKQVLPVFDVEIDWDEYCARHGYDPKLAWDSVLMAPHPTDALGKIIHSRKPEEVHNALTQWFPDVLKLELFATRETGDQNWIHLGHAISGLDIRDELADLRMQMLRREVLKGQDMFADDIYRQGVDIL